MGQKKDNLRLKDVERLQRYFEEVSKNPISELTEDQCADLIRCSLKIKNFRYCELDKENIEKLLVCVKQPPCATGEIERTYATDNRLIKWCDNGLNEHTTLTFRRKSLRILGRIKKERDERIRQLPKKEREKIKKDEQEINNLYIRFNRLRERAVREDFVDEPVQVSDFSGKDKVFVERFKALQDEKESLELERKILTSTTSVLTQVRRVIQEEQEEEEENEENEEVDREIDASVKETTGNIPKLLNDIIKTLNKNDERMRRIEKEQEYTNRAARKTLGEEYWNEKLLKILRSGPRKIMSELLYSPFRFLNIVVLRPALTVFWKFFGRWFYLIWGMLMLLLLVISIMSFYLYVGKHYPRFMDTLIEIAIELFGQAKETGSLLAEQLSPLYRESFNILMDQIGDYYNWGYSKIFEILTGFMSIIVNFVKSMVHSTVTSVAGSWWPF